MTPGLEAEHPRRHPDDDGERRPRRRLALPIALAITGVASVCWVVMFALDLADKDGRTLSPILHADVLILFGIVVILGGVASAAAALEGFIRVQFARLRDEASDGHMYAAGYVAGLRQAEPAERRLTSVLTHRP